MAKRSGMWWVRVGWGGGGGQGLARGGGRDANKDNIIPIVLFDKYDNGVDRQAVSCSIGCCPL